MVHLKSIGNHDHHKPRERKKHTEPNDDEDEEKKNWMRVVLVQVRRKRSLETMVTMDTLSQLPSRK